MLRTSGQGVCLTTCLKALPPETARCRACGFVCKGEGSAHQDPVHGRPAFSSCAVLLHSGHERSRFAQLLAHCAPCEQARQKVRSGLGGKRFQFCLPAYCKLFACRCAMDLDRPDNDVRVSVCNQRKAVASWKIDFQGRCAFSSLLRGTRMEKEAVLLGEDCGQAVAEVLSVALAWLPVLQP